MARIHNKTTGAFFGLAIGDALGAPVEFMRRGTFPLVKGYRAGGKFRLQPGEWTDDTAMALCLAQSLIERKGFDPTDQIRKYLSWLDEGYMSCQGKAIGAGKTVLRSLIRFRSRKKPYTSITHEKFSGNGSIMRLAPVAIFYLNDIKKAVHYAALSSKTTHGSPIAIDACRLMAYTLVRLFNGMDKAYLFSTDFTKELNTFFASEPLHSALQPIVEQHFINKNAEQIKSTGYTVDTLEAAFWSLYHTECFHDALLTAVNLGDDADTVGAVTGQLAGALYGSDAIPEDWKKPLCKSDMLLHIAKILTTFSV